MHAIMTHPYRVRVPGGGLVARQSEVRPQGDVAAAADPRGRVSVLHEGDKGLLTGSGWGERIGGSGVCMGEGGAGARGGGEERR